MQFHRKILAATLLLTIGACRTFYVFPPVEVTTERLSPTYRLTISNNLSGELSIVPSQGSTAEQIILAPGEAADFTLLVKILKVGGSQVPQVIEGDFIEVEGPGFGGISLRADELGCPGCVSCDLRLDVRNSSWFAERQQNENVSPTAEVCVDECQDGRVVFRNGPGSECRR
ncbi:MAG: hypothetical protein GQ537_03415 [Gammaproteobacteria bacterium]|jgi:hypothetical protein|nr:hypothetical protein [Gammaproteobacteria bacterium]